QAIALGIAEAADLFGDFPATFAGQSVTANSILISYTLYGDANLDKTVDTLDFNSLAVNFSLSPARWSLGDFNYDTIVDTLDFNVLATLFSLSISAPSGAAVPSSVLSPGVPASAGMSSLPISSNPFSAHLILSNEDVLA